jgi:hypothetical protein
MRISRFVRRRTTAAGAIAASGLALVLVVAVPPTASVSAATTTAKPCVGAPVQPVTHVVVIVMENKNYGSIIGSSAAPYLNSLANACGLATSYHAIRHPSLPNYLAMTGGSTFGVTDDKPPAYHPISGASVFSELGARWRSYQEDMAVRCQAYNGPTYAVRHDPATYYTNLAASCPLQDVPLPARPDFSAAFTFVTPNLQHDMHDGTIEQGDTWLSTFVPKILASSQYQSGSLALFIVWDENDGPDHAPSNQVPCLVVAPSVPAQTRVSTWFDHYSLLATWQDLLGLSRMANTKTAATMAGAFRL